MELSWQMKLRIAGSAAVGVLLIGVAAWPLASPEPMGAVSLAVNGFGIGGAILLAILAFVSGALGYLVSRPWGREIGVLAVPSGLAIWAIRSGSMAGLMQNNPGLAQRQALLSMLTLESAFWLFIVAVGFAGVMVSSKIAPSLKPNEPPIAHKSRFNKYLNILLGLVCSVLLAQLCIRLFARDVVVATARGDIAVGPPAIGQLVFAVLVSFAAAGFVAKKLLNLDYIWPAISTAIVSAIVIGRYVRSDILENTARLWPGSLMPSAAVSILPVQMVAIGTLGAVVGYWLAVRYDYWRKHEV